MVIMQRVSGMSIQVITVCFFVFVLIFIFKRYATCKFIKKSCLQVQEDDTNNQLLGFCTPVSHADLFGF